MEVVSNKVVLELALVGVVTGNKPNLNVFNVQAYIKGHFGAPPGSFTVHPHHPEDFLVLFCDTALMVWVLYSPIPLGAVRIAFKWWNRANWASAVSFDYQLRIGLVGIPAHLWLTSTAHEVLGVVVRRAVDCPGH
jgi:hypothetical protein